MNGIVLETHQAIAANLIFSHTDDCGGTLDYDYDYDYDYGLDKLYNVEVAGGSQAGIVEMIRQVNAPTYRVTRSNGAVYFLENVVVKDGLFSGNLLVTTNNETV